MKLKIRTRIIAIIFPMMLLVNSSAFAGWSGWYSVLSVYSYADGGIFVMLDPYTAHPNPGGCVSPSWLRMGPTQANTKDVFKLALTAQAAGRKVNVYVDGCVGSYAKILHMRTG